MTGVCRLALWALSLFAGIGEDPTPHDTETEPDHA